MLRSSPQSETTAQLRRGFISILPLAQGSSPSARDASLNTANCIHDPKGVNGRCPWLALTEQLNRSHPVGLFKPFPRPPVLLTFCRGLHVLLESSLFGQGGAACRPWARARCYRANPGSPENDGPSHCCCCAHCLHHRTSSRVRMEQVCRCGLSINRRLAIQRSTAEQASAATQALLTQHLGTTLH